MGGFEGKGRGMKRGMVAAISVIALVFGWGVAHAQDASPGGIPGQAQPVAPPTAQGDINIEVKPQPPAGTKLTQPMVPGTTTDTRVVPATSSTTTTTTPGDVKVEVEQVPGQPPPNGRRQRDGSGSAGGSAHDGSASDGDDRAGARRRRYRRRAASSWRPRRRRPL